MLRTVVPSVLAVLRGCVCWHSGGKIDSLTDQPAPRLGTSASTLVFVLAVIVKLVLISHDELAAAPSDPAEYAYAGAQFYFGMPYNAPNYARLGTYPLFLSVNTMLGVPARLGIELVWCAASYVTLIALCRLGLTRWVATLAGVLLVLLPMSITALNTLHADALYAPAMLALVMATSVSCVASSRGEFARWELTAALAGVLTTCRAELILTYAALAGSAVVISLCRIVGMIDGPLFFRRLRAAFITPLLAVLVFTTAIKLGNLTSIGAFVDQDLSSPGVARLYNALLAIPPENPSLEMQIPRDVREKAYAASPTFARFKPFLESSGMTAFQIACQRVCVSRGVTYTPGEYGGWSIWALRGAVWQLGPHTSLRDVDAVYQRAADELRGAMSRGELPSRFAPFSYIAPEWHLLVQGTPSAISRTFGVLTSPHYAPSRHVASTPEELSRQRLFNSVTLRRAQLLKPPDEGPNTSRWHSKAVADTLTSLKVRLDRAFSWLPIIALVCLPIAILFGLRVRPPLAGLLTRSLDSANSPSSAGATTRLGVLVLSLAAGGMFAARLLMFAAIDLNGIPTQARYLLPCAALAVVVLAIEIDAIAKSLFRPTS